MRKIRKRNHFSSENKHIGDFIKTILAPQQLSSAVCKVAWERHGLLPKETGVEQPGWSQVTLCVCDPGQSSGP